MTEAVRPAVEKPEQLPTEKPKPEQLPTEKPKPRPKLSKDLKALKDHISQLSSIKDSVTHLVTYALDHPGEAEVIRANMDELAAAVATGVQGQTNVPAT